MPSSRSWLEGNAVDGGEVDSRVGDDAWAFLRANTTAGIQFGEHLQDACYVLSHGGELILPVMTAMLQAVDVVLHVPAFEEGAMQLHCTLIAFEEGGRGDLADRWRVYHGEPPDTNWAIAEINAARFHEFFVDGEVLRRENPCSEHEAVTCMEINSQRRDALAEACRDHARVDVREPILVGIDDLGWDVRATFGILRLPADPLG